MLIAFHGKKLSGKTTSADYLVKTHKFKKCSFAQKGKETCGDIFQLTHEQLYGSLKEVVDERYNVTPVFIMQRFMTEVTRHIYEPIWIKCLERKISSFKEGTNIVIDDLRFQNEAEWVINNNGVIIHISRSETYINDSHASEQGIDENMSVFHINNYSQNVINLYLQIEFYLKEYLITNNAK